MALEQALSTFKLTYALRGDGVYLTPEQILNMEANDAQTLYQIGEDLMHLGKYEKSIEWLRKAAAQNHSEAQGQIGFIYSQGYGVKEDGKEALDWYIKALDNGYISVAYDIGDIYYKGREGVPRNIHKAIDYFKIAADSDLAMNAQFNLGSIYQTYVTDLQQAANWYKKADDNGHPQAFRILRGLRELGYLPQVDTDKGSSSATGKPLISYSQRDVNMMKINLKKMGENHKKRRDRIEAEKKKFQQKVDQYERERVEKEKSMQKRIDTLEQERTKQKAAMEQRIATLEQDKSEKETALLEELNSAKEDRKKLESDIQQLNEFFAKFKSVLA